MLIVLAVAGFGGYSLYARNQIREAGSSQEMMKYKPADGTKSLHELMEKNPDVIGWITMNGTRIDQPVVQGKDDSEYLNRDAEGRFSLAGSVFLTCENHPDFSDSYNLLYGHHMEEGGMFGDVIEYLDGSFFRKHQTGTLTTGDGRWQIHVFAVLKTGASDPYV
ncbi:class B sortase, partial [Faecalibaculum rodentium]|uniref:class B sortase n=1 Tax=Faecalibaculum rodentium TaxID=1702221 RepID=UPI0023F18AD2